MVNGRKNGFNTREEAGNRDGMDFGREESSLEVQALTIFQRTRQATSRTRTFELWYLNRFYGISNVTGRRASVNQIPVFGLEA